MNATVTSKNQITIPEPIRRSMKLQKGDHLVFEPVKEGWILRNIPKSHLKSDGAAKQYVRRKTPMSLAEMKTAAADQAARDYFSSSE